MKQKIYILGLLTILILVAGTVFKVNHYAGAGILLTLGIFALVIVFLPLALLNSYRSEENSQSSLLYIVTWITAFVVFTAMLFKVQHWPYAGVALMIALPFPYVVFLPVYLYVTSKIKNFNIYNTVFVMLLLAGLSGFSALLALSVSKERIDQSLSLSIHYKKYEKALTSLPSQAHDNKGTIKHPGLIQKADSILFLLQEAQKKIHDKAGITEGQWLTDPEASRKFDSRNVSGVLYDGMPPFLPTRLENTVKSFLAELENTEGCKDIAAVAPLMLGYTSTDSRESGWAQRLFIGNYLSWVIINMDDIRVNLLELKREISSI
jgi:hypothetical protein